MSATPVSSTQRITRSELNLFLDDIEQNINTDDNADFKKLILYLFSFTNEKLLHVHTASDGDEEKLLLRLLNTIELVMSKRLHLLNAQLRYDDYKSIFQPSTVPNETAGVGVAEDDKGDADGGATSSLSLLSSSNPILLYDWSILFALNHIPHYHNHVHILNQIKSFIIHIINLVTTKLHNIKYISLLRSKLLSIIDANLDRLMGTTSQEIMMSSFNQKLIQTVHLFSILNDYDLSKKLSLHLINFQLKFESYSRKIWFILNELYPINSQDSTVQLLDNLKSIVIMNLTDNLVLYDSITWNQISIVLTWIIDYLRFDSKDFDRFRNLNKSSSYTLLKMFLLCVEKDVVENFINCHNLKSLLTKLTDPLFVSNLPLIILKSLHIIKFYYNLLINEDAIVNKYQTSVSNQFIITPFPDPELETLRLQLLNLNPNPSATGNGNHYFDANIIKRELLDFIIPPQFKFEEMESFQNHHNNANDLQIISQELNCTKWINHVRDLVVKNPELFDVDYSLYTFITALGNFPCILHNDYNYKINECVRCGTGPMTKGYFNIIDPNRDVFHKSSEILVLYEDIICDFLISKKRQVFESNPLLCCNLLLTIFKLFASYSPQRSNFHDERVFTFLMSLLDKDNNRDVRLLVARIFPLYLIKPRLEDTEQTFKAIFQIVANVDLTTDNRRHFGESTIKALQELAIISQGERLCVIILKMIDFFGSYNEQHVNYVYNAFLNISAAKSLTPYRLLSPYLPSIAELIIMNDRMLLKVTELLGITKNMFLFRTREYTTPRLLENYKHDYINEIAQACDLSKEDLVGKNLNRILAFYLVKDEVINESYIIDVLSNISPKYKLKDLDSLISKSGELTWFILIQIQVDEHNEIENKVRIYNALQYLAIASLKYKKKPIEARKSYVEQHLGEYVLELIQKFNENVHHIKGTKPYLEKVSSLRAIEFLINNNIDAVTTALGQISTCLQATLENPDFQYFALRNFHALVKKLPSNHLISMIDIIISSIYQTFETFDKLSQEIAGSVLKEIYDVITGKYHRYGLYFLSIPFLEYLQTSNIVQGQFKSIKKLSKLVIFQEFTRRLKTSNEYVVQQALFDLDNYCQQYQQNCQSDYFKDAILEPHVGDLIRTILDTAAKFKNKNEKISTACARTLSVIGALDANRFKYKSIKSQIVIIQDFKDYRENSEFLVDFIENRVLKIFWASRDPMKQLFSAYAIQNFLKILKLDFKILTPNSQDYLIDVWNNFSDIAKSTLTPLLSSQYIAPPSKYEPLQFPHFKLGMKYENWLIDFTFDLLKRPLTSVFETYEESSKSSKSEIFLTLSRLIRDQDISICHYLLKYVALSHIVNGNEEATQNIKHEFLHILHIDSTSLSSGRVESLKLCYQAVFEVLDYLHEWVSTTARYMNSTTLEASDIQRMKQNIVYVREFIEFIPMDLIAVKSAESDSYERTILYLEKCYRGGKVEDSVQLVNLNFVTTLQTMYSNIDDYDALNGVLQKFSTNNLGEKLKTFQYNDNWSVAQESFQILGTTGDRQIDNNTKLLKSLNEHGLHEEVLSTLAEKCDERTLTSIPLDWALVGLQSSVYSGDIKEIKKWFFIVNSLGKPQDVDTLITYEFAKGVNFLFENKTNEFSKCMNNLYKVIGNSLVPTVSSGFSRNVNLMNRLHSIHDLSFIMKSDSAFSKAEKEVILTERLANIDQSFDTQLQILSLHNVGNSMKSNHSKVPEVLIYISSLARKNNRLDISTRSIMKAMALNYDEANTEYTKLLWAQGKQTEAIKSLSDIIKDDNFTTVEKKAEVQLQYAKWLDESNHLSSQAIISEYEKALELNSSSEKAYYDLGSYFNKIFQSGNDQSGYYQQQTVRNFLKSLSLGSRYIFEGLPKVVTIWLDLTQKTDGNKERDRRINLMLEDIGKSMQTIPHYVWYTAITQLLSRIVHDHAASYKVMAQILSLIIRKYPQHSLWYVLSHSNANDNVRKDRIASILKLAISQSRSEKLREDIESSRVLFSSLIAIAAFKITKQIKTRRLSLSKNFQVTALQEPFKSLVIPVRSNLEIRLPAVYSSGFHGFPSSASVTFDGVDDNVNIFFSLQMPRQITVRGSDGKAYRLMVKRDDTRKDAKVGEFTTVINRLLSASNETRKRSLQIPNYAVIPLAENLGVIEFVTDVQPLKAVLADQRKRMGIPFNERKMFMKFDEAQKRVKNAQSKDNEPMSELMRLFSKFVKDNPPVLHNWFIDQFSDPSAWYLARTNWTRSLAVMSIVGYIIGLGDRHCENMLVFKRTGSALHIDFDCLFDKGATLPTPEIVPFRLTHNLIDAMGICGIEGSFRITCEVTGSLLRENEAPLMNILETLLYDPLLDWKTQKPDAHLSKVRRKLRGLVNEREGLPMNISGQVDVLIQEATSTERLARMYGGWAPYV